MPPSLIIIVTIVIVTSVQGDNVITYYTLYSRPVRSNQFLILHIKYNTYLYFSIICINNFYKKIVTFGHEAFSLKYKLLF